MVVPTESFTEIGDADIDPDSPITTGLMTDYRDNDLNLNSQLIGETAPFVAAQKHDHDGVNSALVDLAASLNPTLFDLTISGSGTQTASTGALGFTPVAMWVIYSGSHETNQLMGVGFAIGTGTLAKGIGWSLENDLTGGASPSSFPSGIDADAIGGTVIAVQQTAFTIDIDVTVFSAANITFSTGGAGVKAVELKVLVIGS